MTAQTPTTTLDQETVDRLAAAYHRCFSHHEAEPGTFADDTFFDLMPPLWRFQIQGPGETFAAQLRSIAIGPLDLDVLRTIPTATGFVSEHVETQHGPDGDLTARRVHVCEVRDGRITAVTVYCNGGWDDALRSRHATEAPMIRP